MTDGELWTDLALSELAGRLITLLYDERHLIQFTDDGWTIAHPLIERVDGSLFDCEWRWTGDDPGVRGRFYMDGPADIGGTYEPETA